MRANRVLVWLERTLLIVGAVCLGWYGYSSIEAAQFQREQAAVFEHMLASSPIAVPPTPAVAPMHPSSPPAAKTEAFPIKRPAFVPTNPKMIGMLEIPRLKMTTAVMSGDDDKTLKVSAGHLPDTPRPWERGNSAIAAHRDSHFRPLKNIRVGDEIRVRTTRGDLEYRVRDIKIVTPDDLSVLKPTKEDSLTLITCYPFNYIGSAPKRYIVRAERID